MRKPELDNETAKARPADDPLEIVELSNRDPTKRITVPNAMPLSFRALSDVPHSAQRSRFGG